MSLKTLPVPAPSMDGTDEASHEICCVDPTIGMCGLPLDDSPITSGLPSCVVCLSLLDAWAANADAHGDFSKNPGDPPCPCCPKRWKDAR